MEAEIDEIIKRHSEKRYDWNDSERVFNASDRDKMVKDIIWLLNRELAKQDAKIYAYEAIISNSNFKAVLLKEGKNKCQKPSS